MTELNPVWSINDWLVENSSSWWILLIAFIFSELVNVVLSTIKSVVLIKGSKKASVLVNTLSYTINAFITALIGSVVNNVWLVCIVVAITNASGVWFGLSLVEKVRKDRLWRISATVKNDYYDNLILDLKANNIKFVTYATDWDKIELIDVFSKTKKESKIIKILFEKYKVRYTISENEGVL